MTTDSSDLNSRFYHSLKNAQPIAFLASFSMVIAAFSFSNYESPDIYKNAVLATVMFLISFVVSLLDQMAVKRKDEEDIGDVILHWGKFFFLGFGIIYLGLVALEFSKDLPQVWKIITGWGSIAIGGSFATTLISQKGKLKRSFYLDSKNHIFANLFDGIFSFGLIAIGILYVGQAFIEYKIDSATLDFVFGIMIAVSFMSLFISFFIIIKTERKKKKADQN